VRKIQKIKRAGWTSFLAGDAPHPHEGRRVGQQEAAREILRFAAHPDDANLAWRVYILMQAIKEEEESDDLR